MGSPRFRLGLEGGLKQLDEQGLALVPAVGGQPSRAFVRGQVKELALPGRGHR
jgi:hypothetical protein